MNKYLRIFLILGVAYIISDFSINNVFLAQSPTVNPFFAQNTLAKVSIFWSKTTNFIALRSPFKKSTSDIDSSSQPVTPLPTKSQNTQMEFAEALSIPLTKISQGIYAGERNDMKVYQIKMNEIEYLEYTFNVNGKEIKIKVPKGEELPSQEVMEALYK